MPVSGPIPEPILTIVAAATLFTIMFDIGLAVVPGQWRWVWRHTGLLARGLVSTLVVLPPLALLVFRAFDLPRAVEIGILLMAIAPGAPVALRRSLEAGGHPSFAPALQIAMALLAIVSMPAWVAVLNVVYAGHASIAPGAVARQVLLAQLLPLAAGMLVRPLLAAYVARLEPRIARLGKLLLALLLVLALVDVWQDVVDAGPRIGLAIVLITALATVAGHLLGGPDASTRTAVAISTGARNAGLALLVATLNAAPPETIRTVLAYLVLSALTLLPYVAWRRRAAPVTAPAH